MERRLPALTADTTLRRNAATAAVYPTFYGGYHTVGAHRQHLRDVAARTRPSRRWSTTATRGSRRRGRGGHDLLAICITRKTTGDCALSPTAPKPRSVVYAAIHARELATAEIAWNWIDHLTTSYGSNATVTNLLNSTEIWVIPVANPDGRQIVESGGNAPYYQRKNANDSRGSCRRPPTSSNQHGVDMNRNATWHWGGVGSVDVRLHPDLPRHHGGVRAGDGGAADAVRPLFRDRRGTGIERRGAGRHHRDVHVVPLLRRA